jgi:hypothetical protein
VGNPNIAEATAEFRSTHQHDINLGGQSKILQMQRTCFEARNEVRNPKMGSRCQRIRSKHLDYVCFVRSLCPIVDFKVGNPNIAQATALFWSTHRLDMNFDGTSKYCRGNGTVLEQAPT